MTSVSPSSDLKKKMAAVSSWDLKEIKRDILKAQIDCSKRGLHHSVKWMAELSHSLSQIKAKDLLPNVEEPEDFLSELEQYTLAKSYFDLSEYRRAAFFVQDCRSDKAYFLHMYSLYKAGAKKALEDAVEPIEAHCNKDNDYLKDLRSDLDKKYKADELDGFCLYLYGVVLKKLDLMKEALDVLVKAIQVEPLHWGAWQELSLIIPDREMLNNLELPDHWLKQFFLGQTYLELQIIDEALKIYQDLINNGFSNSTYVKAQMALVHHHNTDVDSAMKAFADLQKVDPYRLENMDIYSNLLYIKNMRVELACLAHHCCDIDNYKTETCCIIGNYYSLRGQHEKGVLYFQRALKLNPNYLSAWTLMGHEYMELKNTNAAIQSYRTATEVNPRDYRAWYGLGQTYEILKMYSYCLYYYMKAQVLRPNDSRMVMALGEVYEKLDRLQEAKKCYWKAHALGDMEGLALIKLARLFERLGEDDQAAAAFTEYLSEVERRGVYSTEDQSSAYRFLANYHLKRGNLEEAFFAAQKCTEYDETKEEGKALLREISRRESTKPGIRNDPESASGGPYSISGCSTPVLRQVTMNLFASQIDKE
ncbi:hypothetical protein LSH36_230g00037 [Paralvinella palmiformis]|uniref:Cdc23 domain-containing protein n=1 Tax=Paralvinella palmiformis TaxID=53620 RepID=A0AAD9JNR2_9ANNE|nr:hypothetical protein LSH36_230g00037 [Paralvinella palmiformis]